jgi:hypothetical protein
LYPFAVMTHAVRISRHEDTYRESLPMLQINQKPKRRVEPKIAKATNALSQRFHQCCSSERPKTSKFCCSSV